MNINANNVEAWSTSLFVFATVMIIVGIFGRLVAMRYIIRRVFLVVILSGIIMWFYAIVILVTSEAGDSLEYKINPEQYEKPAYPHT